MEISLIDVMAIAVSTTVLVAAVSTILWIWFSHKIQIPLGNLEENLREDFSDRIDRLESRGDRQHEVVMKKMIRIDEEVVKAIERASEARELAVKAHGLAEAAIRDLYRGDR